MRNPTSLHTSIAVLLLFSVSAALAGQAGAAETTPPRPLPGNPFPEYPSQALAEDVEGAVLYRAQVDAGGKVREVEILAVPREGVGFEDAARSALGGWSFEPALRDGEPVAGQFEGKFDFTLTYPRSGARMYPVPSARLFDVLKALLKEYRFRFDEVDPWNGVLITAWRKWPRDSLPGLALPDSPVFEGFRRVQLHLFVPTVVEPARLYVGSLVYADVEGQSYMFHSTGVMEAWLYERVEERLGLEGAAIPRDAARRGRLAAELLGERAESDCAALAEPLLPGSPGLSNPTVLRATTLEPAYPANTRGAADSKRVVLQATINEDGWIAGIVPLELPESNPQCYEAAANAVAFWRYRPAMRDGCPVPVLFKVYVEFH